MDETILVSALGSPYKRYKTSHPSGCVPRHSFSVDDIQTHLL